MNFRGKRVLVLGGAVSGDSAARLLLAQGCRVTVADQRDSAALRAELARAEEGGARLWLGSDALPDEEFDLCVASPAFAPDHAWIRHCVARRIAIIAELELGAACWKGRMIAVTGSKGKSSIVKLCSDTLNMAGRSASPAGNYGIPLSELALTQPDLAWAVTEVSSFQMEHTAHLTPDVAILLNLQPDHMDRHGTMECYRALKFKMFAALKEGAPAFLPEKMSTEGLISGSRNIQRFGVTSGAVWRWQAGVIRGIFNDREVTIDIRGSWFDNQIFGVSASAAAGALLAAGLSAAQIEAGFKNFVPLEHRMERFYCSRSGVHFINDSKATSLAAVMAALKMVKTPVRLIAGGILKEILTETVKELLAQGTEKVYLIGQCSDKMFNAWSDRLVCVKCGTLEEAVKRAVSEAQAGETLLLSPGTASFDQFKSYCERGERFKELVRKVAD